MWEGIIDRVNLVSASLELGETDGCQRRGWYSRPTSANSLRRKEPGPVDPSSICDIVRQELVQGAKLTARIIVGTLFLF